VPLFIWPPQVQCHILLVININISVTDIDILRSQSRNIWAKMKVCQVISKIFRAKTRAMHSRGPGSESVDFLDFRESKFRCNKLGNGNYRLTAKSLHPQPARGRSFSSSLRFTHRAGNSWLRYLDIAINLPGAHKYVARRFRYPLPAQPVDAALSNQLIHKCLP
jgi:hypothetical protein